MIQQVINDLKTLSINVPMVMQSSFGDISLYDNKTTIKYPYINIDVVSSRNQNGAKIYTLRLYICDRNEPYVAYNKAEMILDNLLANPQLDISNYSTNYFTLNFQDNVNGIWADVQYITKQEVDCYHAINASFGYILNEDGDYIKIEGSPQLEDEEGHIILEDKIN